MHDSDKLSAALTGIAVTAAAHVIRRDDDNANRIRQNEDDVERVDRKLRDLQTNGHIVREFMPVVADFQSGIAMARQTEQSPVLVPNLSTITRPDLLSLMQAAVREFTWPPKQGEYDERGYIRKAGELASLGLVLTYEEVRAWLHGFVLPTAPTDDGKLQSFYSASGLVRAIVDQTNTMEEWRALWRKLFGANKHSLAPTVTLLTNAATMQVGAGANDAALSIKFTATAALNAGTQVAKVTFGKKYLNPPAVIVGGPWESLNVSEAEYILVTRIAYNPNDVITVPVVVGACDG